MPATAFDRDSMARWYAGEHLRSDPGVISAHYLPQLASDREIRIVEVNSLISDRTDDILEPIDFGVDAGMETEHRLLILDVNPEQWERIRNQSLQLPPGWSLENAVHFSNE
jgi:hypothetical protein